MPFYVKLTREKKSYDIIFDTLTDKKKIEDWLAKSMFDIANFEKKKLEEIAESLEIRIMQHDLSAKYTLNCVSKFKGHQNIIAEILMQQYEIDMSFSIYNHLEKTNKNCENWIYRIEENCFYLKGRTSYRITNKTNTESILEWLGETYGTNEMDLRECATGLCQYIFENGFKLSNGNSYERMFMYNNDEHYFEVKFNMTNTDRHENIGTGKNDRKTKQSKRN